MKREHSVVLSRTTIDTEPTLVTARDAIARGEDVTVIVVLGDTDRQNIRDYAESEQLSLREAEATYEAATIGAVHHRIGDQAQVQVTWRKFSNADLVELADELRATSLVVPNSIAGGIGWRRSLKDSSITVTLIPETAA